MTVSPVKCAFSVVLGSLSEARHFRTAITVVPLDRTAAGRESTFHFAIDVTRNAEARFDAVALRLKGAQGEDAQNRGQTTVPWQYERALMLQALILPRQAGASLRPASSKHAPGLQENVVYPSSMHVTALYDSLAERMKA